MWKSKSLARVLSLHQVLSPAEASAVIEVAGQVADAGSLYRRSQGIFTRNALA
ncbi:MAG: hypothetical protein QXJ68_02665 [Methanocellales archaeon]